MTFRFNPTDREILRLALPNIVSNITIPLLGMADTAIAGRIGEDANIAALSVGTTIFSMIYWNCAFLRMGTGGITAQAYGADRPEECANMLARSVWVAAALALLLLAFQRPIGHASLALMQAGDHVSALAADYFFARVWAAPASILLFSLQGWLIGMQDARTPMFIAILSNVANVAFSFWFALGLGWGIAGVAWGTVVAQYAGLLVAVAFLWLKYRGYLRLIDLRASLSPAPLVHFLTINRDIFLRTLCVVTAYTFFTVASARFGDTILTTNAVLMQLFTLFSFLADGFAYAGEALSGRFVGERNAEALHRFIRRLMGWSLIIAVAFVGVYALCWRQLLAIFSPSSTLIATAGRYIVWIIAVPLVGAVPFMIDGIMIGATRTRILRNTVFYALVLYLAVFYALAPLLGNTALWIAFLTFLFARGFFLYVCSGRLNVERIIGGATAASGKLRRPAHRS